ncbi:hypothetical protein CLNEO_12060 [Anaerotignum neopropionicum]|uniref:Uncharacterized protein n=1 Tax=Anaerotignum neopropionicum TaxID=36847 RepID=A0A136WFF3_9FIRM|nr:hypothetical protein [Anaerotignum neopropionicum]KXL53235.1 hypothetical protein CLNEO_12060 [Anaerotignum neopropionicum]
MNEKRNPKISIGIVSLVVILTVLCLTIFSVMTLTTALNEKQLAEKAAIALENYYNAEAHCSKIANEIGEIWKEAGNKDDLQAYAKANKVDCHLEKNKLYFRYQCSVDERQTLFVTISVGDTFEIEQWCVQATSEWVPDESIIVWDGESIE